MVAYLSPLSQNANKVVLFFPLNSDKRQCVQCTMMLDTPFIHFNIDIKDRRRSIAQPSLADLALCAVKHTRQPPASKFGKILSEQLNFPPI